MFYLPIKTSWTKLKSTLMPNLHVSEKIKKPFTKENKF